jgi:CheY-like chemotaxis protein
VLVVEDQQDFLELLKVVLEGEGFYVAAAEDGEKAIELLKQFRPAVIVTDLMMPKISGVDLIRYVRQKQELSKIPIIATSAARSGTLNEAKQAGANETVKKPIDFDELVKLLDRYVPAHAPMSGG